MKKWGWKQPHFHFYMKILKQVLLAVLCTNLVLGDVLHLHDGTRVKGTFVSYNFWYGKVVFRTDQGRVMDLDIRPEKSVFAKITDNQGKILLDPERRYRLRKILIFSALGLAVVGIITSIRIGGGNSGSTGDQNNGGNPGPVE